jgi:hypothetical protein
MVERREKEKDRDIFRRHHTLLQWPCIRYLRPMYICNITSWRLPSDGLMSRVTGYDRVMELGIRIIVGIKIIVLATSIQVTPTMWPHKAYSHTLYLNWDLCTTLFNCMRNVTLTLSVISFRRSGPWDVKGYTEQDGNTKPRMVIE